MEKVYCEDCKYYALFRSCDHPDYIDYRGNAISRNYINWLPGHFLANELNAENCCTRFEPTLWARIKNLFRRKN